MKVKLLIAGILCSVILLSVSVSCTKNNPQPPVHDTIYAPKPDTTVNLTKGLLLYLNFSGNIADSSGNNNPTTAVGNVLTYDEHGFANNAFGALTSSPYRAVGINTSASITRGPSAPISMERWSAPRRARVPRPTFVQTPRSSSGHGGIPSRLA